MYDSFSIFFFNTFIILDVKWQFGTLTIFQNENYSTVVQFDNLLYLCDVCVLQGNLGFDFSFNMFQ